MSTPEIFAALIAAGISALLLAGGIYITKHGGTSANWEDFWKGRLKDVKAAKERSFGREADALFARIKEQNARRENVKLILGSVFGFVIIFSMFYAIIRGIGGAFYHFLSEIPLVICSAVLVATFVGVLAFTFIRLLLAKISARRIDKIENAITTEGWVYEVKNIMSSSSSTGGGASWNLVSVAVRDVNWLLRANVKVRLNTKDKDYMRGDKVIVKYDRLKPKRCKIQTEKPKRYSAFDAPMNIRDGGGAVSTWANLDLFSDGLATLTFDYPALGRDGVNCEHQLVYTIQGKEIIFKRFNDGKSWTTTYTISGDILTYKPDPNDPEPDTFGAFWPNFKKTLT